MEAPDDLGRIVVALPDEALVECRHGALDVAHVEVGDVPRRTERLDGIEHGCLAAHLGDRPETQVERPRGARGHRPCAAERVDAAEQPRHATERRDRRVVRVQAQPDAGLLGDRDHGLDEVLVVRPHRVVVEHPVGLVLRAPDERVVLRLLAPGDEEVGLPLRIEGDRMVVPGDDRATAAVRALRRAPDLGREEVVAEERDPGRSEVPDRRLEVLDLLVAARPPEHDVHVEAVGDVLDRLEAESCGLGPLPERQQVGRLPAARARQGRGVEVDARHPELQGVGDVVVGQAGDLAEGDAHPLGFPAARPPPGPSVRHRP